MEKHWYKPYDSPEELYVSWYLDEMIEAGYVIKYDYQPDSFALSSKGTYGWRKKLKTKNKDMVSTLLQEHVYTADFEVMWEPSAVSLLLKALGGTLKGRLTPFWAEITSPDSNIISTWEVKPLFDRNNMTRLFTINQKWVYDKYGIYVQKIIPQKLFKDTFTPERYLLTDSGKQKRKLNFTPRTLEEYVESRRQA